MKVKYFVFSVFFQAEEVETYLENLKEKKGLSGKYQTSSKLFQNCSELFKAQVMFDSGWKKKVEVKNVMLVFLVISISHSTVHSSDRNKLEACSDRYVASHLHIHFIKERMCFFCV